ASIWGTFMTLAISLREAEAFVDELDESFDVWPQSGIHEHFKAAFLREGSFNFTESELLVRWSAGCFLNIAVSRAAIGFERIISNSLLYLDSDSDERGISKKIQLLRKRLVAKVPRSELKNIPQLEKLLRIFDSQAGRYNTIHDIHAESMRLEARLQSSSLCRNTRLSRDLLALVDLDGAACTRFVWTKFNAFK